MSAFDQNALATAGFEPPSRVDDDRGLAEAPVVTLTISADAPRMVIVEDAPLIALDLAETMRDLGFDVRATAFTHEQAVAEIERWVPQYAIVDLHLGGGDQGVPQAEALLGMLSARGCRCLVFSGDQQACARVAERFPNFPVLSKPAQPERLIREMQKLRGIDAA